MTSEPEYLVASQLIPGDRIRDDGAPEDAARNLITAVASYSDDGAEVVELTFADQSRIRTVPAERFYLDEMAPSIEDDGARIPRPAVSGPFPFSPGDPF